MAARETLALGWFVLGLVTGHSYEETGYVAEGEREVRELETPRK
jgi:hypothetical protein